MKITVKANAGLGNRIRVLGSCVALSQQLEHEIDVIWERNTALNCSFYDLFEEIPGIKVKELPYIPKWNKLWLGRRKRFLSTLNAQADCRLGDAEIRQIQQLKSDFLKLIKSFDRIYIDTCERFYGDPTFIAFIQPISSVSHEIMERTIQMDGQYIGVHVRRGDNIKSTEISSLDAFCTQMDHALEADAEAKFYISTDSAEVADQLKKKYSEAAIYFQSSYQRNKPRAIQLALIDFIMLANASAIIGSYWSSFSEEAANYHGVPLYIAQ